MKYLKILYYRLTLASSTAWNWILAGFASLAILTEIGEDLSLIDSDYTITVYGTEWNVPTTLKIIGAVGAFAARLQVRNKEKLKEKLKDSIK